MGYIFENEIESIINGISTKTIGEEDEITLKKILKASIPSSIKAYIRSEIEKILAEERKKEIRSKKLPYGIPEIVSLQHQIDKLLVLHYQITREEFESFLDEAVHFQFNYLCRPRWTLINFIFGQAHLQPASTILSKLSYCVDYSYFPKALKRYILYHGLTELNYELFRDLIEKIDKEVVNQYQPYELSLMLKPIFSFLQTTLPQQDGELTIPINAAIVFFEDKKLELIKERLEIERDIKATTQVTFEDLNMIIHSINNNDSEITSLPEESQKTFPEETINSSVTENLVTEPYSTKNTETFHSLETNSVIETHSITDDQTMTTEKTNLSAQTETAEKNYVSLLDTFPQNIRNRIIKKLFNKDEAEFIITIREIDKIQTWEDVALYLDALFLSKHIDPFSEEAILFTDTLYELYHPRNNYS